jgi:hypothetical protein
MLFTSGSGGRPQGWDIVFPPGTAWKMRLKSEPGDGTWMGGSKIFGIGG